MGTASHPTKPDKKLESDILAAIARLHNSATHPDVRNAKGIDVAMEAVAGHFIVQVFAQAKHHKVNPRNLAGQTIEALSRLFDFHKQI